MRYVAWVLEVILGVDMGSILFHLSLAQFTFLGGHDIENRMLLKLHLLFVFVCDPSWP
jgi:hypothetical protein